jgi:hypothetical protein
MYVTKLNPTQLSILAAADGREDGGLIRPSNLRPAAAAKIAAKLIEARLVREVRAKGDLPVWREDEAGRTYSLAMLKAGRIAVRAFAERHAEDASAKSIAGDDQSASGSTAETASTSQQGSAADCGGRNTKRALIISMLQQPKGASIADLIAATGWLPHTTRAALSGLRKAGLALERRRDAEIQGSVYRLMPATAEAA